MTITNALASVAVKEIKAAAQWYANVIGRPADSTPMPDLAEWNFPSGGWLQVYALPARAGSCSWTLAVSSVDLEAARLEKLGVSIGDQMGKQAKVFMVKDPDGNSIAFAQSPDRTAMHDTAAIVRAAYEAYVSKDRAAIEALIDGDFHFTSPLDNQIDRKTYFDRCWPISETMAAIDVERIVVSGDKAFVTYESRTKEGKRFRNTELFTVRNGKITDVEVYFGWSVPHEAPAGKFLLVKEEKKP